MQRCVPCEQPRQTAPGVGRDRQATCSADIWRCVRAGLCYSWGVAGAHLSRLHFRHRTERCASWTTANAVGSSSGCSTSDRHLARSMCALVTQLPNAGRNLPCRWSKQTHRVRRLSPATAWVKYDQHAANPRSAQIAASATTTANHKHLLLNCSTARVQNGSLQPRRTEAFCSVR